MPTPYIIIGTDCDFILESSAISQGFLFFEGQYTIDTELGRQLNENLIITREQNEEGIVTNKIIIAVRVANDQQGPGGTIRQMTLQEEKQQLYELLVEKKLALISNDGVWVGLETEDEFMTETVFPELTVAIIRMTSTTKLTVSIDTEKYQNSLWQDADIVLPTDELEGLRSQGDTITHLADCVIEYTQTTVPTSSAHQVTMRELDDNNHWRIQVGAGGTLTFREINLGVGTSRVAVGLGSVTDGDRIKVKADGNVYDIYIQEVLIGTYTDPASFLITETSARIRNAPSGGAISDFVSFPLDPDGQREIVRKWKSEGDAPADTDGYWR